MTMNKRADKDIQELNVKSADGRAIYSCIQKPEGNGPFPVVIFIHGGLGDNPEYTRAMLDWSVAELLFQKRFVVFSTDYRVDLSGKDIGDVVAAFKLVAGLPFVDEQKIAYFGDSHGAFLAIMAATQTGPFALIHGWGVADMAEWYRHIKGLPVSYYKRISEDLAMSLGGTPDQIPEAYRQVSPTTHVADIKCPILILHGDKDEDVPVAHAHIMAHAIAKAGGEFELKIFKDAGHGLRSPKIRKAMDPLVLEFLNRY
jgi:dipeptidyl aminopeptidase/acylaminoacyl peptidase